MRSSNELATDPQIDNKDTFNPDVRELFSTKPATDSVARRSDDSDPRLARANADCAATSQLNKATIDNDGTISFNCASGAQAADRIKHQPASDQTRSPNSANTELTFLGPGPGPGPGPKTQLQASEKPQLQERNPAESSSTRQPVASEPLRRAFDTVQTTPAQANDSTSPAAAIRSTVEYQVLETNQARDSQNAKPARRPEATGSSDEALWRRLHKRIDTSGTLRDVLERLKESERRRNDTDERTHFVTLPGPPFKRLRDGHPCAGANFTGIPGIDQQTDHDVHGLRFRTGTRNNHATFSQTVKDGTIQHREKVYDKPVTCYYRDDDGKLHRVSNVRSVTADRQSDGSYKMTYHVDGAGKRGRHDVSVNTDIDGNYTVKSPRQPEALPAPGEDSGNQARDDRPQPRTLEQIAKDVQQADREYWQKHGPQEHGRHTHTHSRHHNSRVRR